MVTLLTTKQVAAYIGVNEKMVYSLVAEKGLPASKITGKWLFPRHLVDQWIEAITINYPDPRANRLPETEMLIIVGSNDPLPGQNFGNPLPAGILKDPGWSWCPRRASTIWP